MTTLKRPSQLMAIAIKDSETAAKDRKMKNSSVNQDIKTKFVGIHVYCNVNTIMQDLLEHDDDCELYDSIDNMQEFCCPLCSHGEPSMIEFEPDDSREHEENYTCPECCYDFDEELEPEYQDILEWWAVSQDLYSKLKSFGCPVLQHGNTYVWGRCTSGQAIIMDHSISQICSDMEILEGQSNSWGGKK